VYSRAESVSVTISGAPQSTVADAFISAMIADADAKSNTALIGFPAGADSEAPALREVPHFTYPAWASYDGQFYAQRALDPFCRDPLVDHAIDLPPFRARRILFSWTAYTLGLGRPAWIIEIYALQNHASCCH
jgi:hypothetical protein